MLNFPWEKKKKNFKTLIGNRWHSSSSVLLRIAQEENMKINTDSVQQTFPHQEILTNHKCQAHVVDSVMLDNLLLAIRIQEISGNYRQGHGTRCQFNGCPQQYLVTRKSTDLCLQYVQIDYFFNHKSWEPREGIFITLVVFLKAWIFHAALFPSESKDANQIYHGPSRENNLWIFRQSEIYLLHHKVHQHIFYSQSNGNFPRIRTLESSHIILLESTHTKKEKNWSRCT